MMKFFADENVPRVIVEWLRGAGQDVMYAAEQKPGESDAVWLQQARVEERLILTSDKDFGELVFRDHLNSHGVVLLRMEDLTIQQRLARLQATSATCRRGTALPGTTCASMPPTRRIGIGGESRLPS